MNNNYANGMFIAIGVVIFAVTISAIPNIVFRNVSGQSGLGAAYAATSFERSGRVLFPKLDNVKVPASSQMNTNAIAMAPSAPVAVAKDGPAVDVSVPVMNPASGPILSCLTQYAICVKPWQDIKLSCQKVTGNDPMCEMNYILDTLDCHNQLISCLNPIIRTKPSNTGPTGPQQH